MLRVLIVLLFISGSAWAGNIDTCLTDPPCSPQDQAARDARTQAALQKMRDDQRAIMDAQKNFTFPHRTLSR
jgi:hypothetical protein